MVLPAGKASRGIGASGGVNDSVTIDISSPNYRRHSPHAASSRTVTSCCTFVWHQGGRKWLSCAPVLAPEPSETREQFYVMLHPLMPFSKECQFCCKNMDCLGHWRARIADNNSCILFELTKMTVLSGA